MDQITQWIESIMSLWMVYPLLSLFTIGDALLPVVPAESLLTLAGSWAGSRGVPWVWGIVLAGIIGGMIGDNLSYLLGARMVKIGRRFKRAPGAKKVAHALTWINKSVETRPGLTIIVARFIPWARWVLTIIMGANRYPWWKFFLFDTIGVLIWATQATLIGFAGGWVLRDYPLLGMALGLVIGSLVGVVLDKIANRIQEMRSIRSATSSA